LGNINDVNLFEDITLFSNRTLEAKAKKRPDGKNDVTVQVETHKYKADEKGVETEVPVDDWIEVGALAASEKTPAAAIGGSCARR
jgi:ABC-2 type transport system permease protein